ncbi:MAG: hypothetical protein K6E32_10385, partial [Lachnospiraceae bacterium]|nr:hypothetical protein [Lachnospiraceae bacterium]
MILFFLTFLDGCGDKNRVSDSALTETVINSTEVSAVSEAVNEASETKETTEASAASAVENTAEVPEDFGFPGQVVVYFANWNLDSKEAEFGGEVASIPWESVTYINHAFWRVEPAETPEVTSFDRRKTGLGARTEFSIAPTAEAADMLDEGESRVISGVKRNHFAEYEYFDKLYPDVNIMISVGGWSDSGFFSEMAYTEEGRVSFTKSCIELIKKYPWIDGIDIDWEYPAGSNDGERLPESDADEGCPIFGTPAEDRENFALLMKCLRETMDEEFGAGTKKLTACASASTGWTLPNQDW